MSESSGNCSGSSFCPDQVLLNKNFHSRPSRRQNPYKEIWGWGRGSKVDPSASFLPTLNRCGPNSICCDLISQRNLLRTENPVHKQRGGRNLCELKTGSCEFNSHDPRVKKTVIWKSWGQKWFRVKLKSNKLFWALCGLGNTGTSWPFHLYLLSAYPQRSIIPFLLLCHFL